MKKLLITLLLLIGCAQAAELQLDHTYGPSHLAFSPDGKRLAIAGSDGVRIYESATGRLLQTRRGNSQLSQCLTWSRDGKTLAVGGTSKNGLAEIVVYREGQQEKRWIIGRGDVGALYFSANGQLWSATFNDSAPTYLKVWDTQSTKVQKILLEHYFDRIQFIPGLDGRTLEMVGSGGDFDRSYYFDTVLEKRILESKTDNRWNATRVITNSPSKLRIISATGADYEEFRLQSVGGNGKPVTIQSLGNVCGNAEIKYPYIAACVSKRYFPGYEDLVKIWKVESKPFRLKEVATLDRSAWPRFLSVDPNRKIGAVQTNRGIVTFETENFGNSRFVAQTRQSLAHFPPSTLSVSQNGAQLFNGWWLDANGKPTLPAQKETEKISMLSRGGALSPDGTKLVAGRSGKAGLFFADGSSKNLELWLEKRRFSPYSSDAEIIAAQWSNNGKCFAFTWGIDEGKSCTDGFYIVDGNGDNIRQVNLKNAKLLDFLSPLDFAWSRDGKAIFAVVGNDRNLKPNAQGKEISQIILYRIDPVRAEITATTAYSFLRNELDAQSVQHLVLSLNGETLGVDARIKRGGSFERRLLLFDTANLKKVTDLPLQPAPSKLEYSSLKLGRDFAFGIGSELLMLKGSKLEKWNWRTRQIIDSRWLVAKNETVLLDRD